ncbi:MAG TPA: MutH/Sau3AI family endonuclease [Polyangia bacterium]|nr:MutH/Sau3AI family endonuclease [Polyangia bacterium]
METEAGFEVSRERTLEALLAHARALVGVELGELADGLGLPVPSGLVRTKGWSGQIIEHELGVAPGGTRGPDFASLGVELKTVPVTPALLPLESTAVCQIDPIAMAAESWEGSYVRAKLARVLFVALEVPAGARSVGERRVAAVRLWSPDAEQERLLRADFELFVRGFFRRGRADDITGHLGAVLQVRPKGRNAADTRDGYDAEGRATRVGKSGFYLRPSFIASILKAE